MNTKLTFAAYPAVAALSMLAAFAAHAQGANNDADRAAYGPTVVSTVSDLSRAVVRAQATVARQAPLADVIDQAGYGATVVNTASLRTRAEVRAEAIAAREAGDDAIYSEVGDSRVALRRTVKTDTVRVLASTPAVNAR